MDVGFTARAVSCVSLAQLSEAINALESGVTGDTWESWLKNSFNAPRDATRYPISSLALPVRLDRQRIMIAR